MAIGGFIAYFLKQDWKRLHNIETKKFVAMAAGAALVGGLFGVLINGMADVSMVIRNLFVASAFALFTISPFAINGKFKI